ncbi:MAG TPA: response regulator [Candidatus Binatia bacterium]
MDRSFDKKRILIVDDNHELLDILQQGLKNYTLMVAEDGKEAVEQAFTLQPDLILMDVMMPEMDGPAAIRLIRQNPKTWSIPILAISAGITTSVPEECARIGCDDYVAKPFSFMKLRSRIERLLLLHPR